MSSCVCGSDRRQFWLWRDSNGELHASRFAPTNGAVRSVYATTARDALWAAGGGRQPKHSVHDVEDGRTYWEGRCGAAMAQGMAAI